MWGVEFIDHYLDDYIILGFPDSPQCQVLLDIVERECGVLNVLLAIHSSSTLITFLRMLIDTVVGQLWLPPEKLSQLCILLQDLAPGKSWSPWWVTSTIPAKWYDQEGISSAGCVIYSTFLFKTSRRIYGLVLPMHAPETLSSLE